ncbi:MAG: phage portal protein [Proteobacteria bacterium]|nr:phage portal protein [Pseudomonadota bacterium]
MARGTEQPIDPGFVARAAAGLRFAFTGKGDWFGPGDPQVTQAPADVAGRVFDYPTAINTTPSIRPVGGYTYAQLRTFADSCDIVRLLVETCKDKLVAQAWAIRPIDQTKEPGAREAKITKLLQRPDGEHRWADWLRMVLEDMYVLDAASIYVQRTYGGDLFALRPIDGATIKRLIDPRGWTPAAPAPAYQQILKGLPAVDYTTAELIYRPRNVRTHKVYGYSHVEQIVATAQLWINRQISNLDYYEAGNLPEGFLQGGADWTPDQIAQFQLALDAMLSGNSAERRKVRIIPHDAKYQEAKEPALKSDFDEWLARIACFALGLPPTPFIKQMNRSSSDNDKQSSEESGIEPIRKWVKSVIDDIVQVYIGHDDIEFTWVDADAQDPLERAQIDAIYIANKVVTADEVRADLGLDPLTPAQKEELNPPPPPQLAPDDGKAQPADEQNADGQPAQGG